MTQMKNNLINRYINQFYNLYNLLLDRKPFQGNHGVFNKDIYDKKHLKFKGSYFGIIEYLQYKLNKA